MEISLVVSTRRKPATCLKSFTNFIRNSFIEYIAMGRNQYYNFGVALISIDYIDWSKYNYCSITMVFMLKIYTVRPIPNILGNKFCLRNRQVFSLYRFKLTKINIGTFKDRFTQDLSLVMAWFRQISLYIYLMKT